MEPQQIFNKVATHLLKQNKRSIDKGTDVCLYRGPNGTKCAVGVLIPDSLYLKTMEGRNILSLFSVEVALRELLGEDYSYEELALVRIGLRKKDS